MNLPPIERPPSLRPLGVDMAPAPVTRVLPVAPVNPSLGSVPLPEPTPSVVNRVQQGVKPVTGEGVYTSVSDPGRRGSEAATAPKDWTIHRPEPEKVEDPPPVPMSKRLLDHLKSLWTASASAIQVQQVRNQLETSQANPHATPGVISTEVLTYSPSKINKNEKI